MKDKAKEYTVFWGCMIPFRHPQIEVAARISLPTCGIKIFDAEGFTCCPDPWNMKASSLEDWLTIAMRNLAVGESSSRDLITLCNGCFSTLKEASHIFKNGGEACSAAKERISRHGLSFKGNTNVFHVASVLAKLGSQVTSSVSRPLSGIRVAIHHGCHLLRPSSVVEFDDPFDPSLIENFISSLGCEVVRYEGYTDCCGNASRSQELSLSLAAKKCKAMKEAGADAIVVACPACFEQFDIGQVEIRRRLGDDFSLPVLHIVQILALAQGVEPSSLGFDRHRTKVMPLLERI